MPPGIARTRWSIGGTGTGDRRAVRAGARPAERVAHA